ncbi:hypothetical protein TVAG_132260 [Trichomonas vaginalis G3]|uniref:Right handed beta helix domain-containing protein n=1 Tax=Trichomonas vaginalis (strain ATCC PRA-98 / G3) TaxID=412133 RepID=A2FNK9_TRIV3|nr:pectin lyase-like family [Trichomonas vaginalis G3]EAX93509.1 hypothetical protein TVAG_132260 [Trichomonas vaginalis G3]KAI5511582.1 pectin lyase-like family [Trichomonas vaginalis G3]|eukprot:XP_001306439.1 hypothetical protein [Trichomonas vaginalis G3]
MICQQSGNSSLSNANISNCIANYGVAFTYLDLKKSITKVSFCNFERLKANSGIITQFTSSGGRIENCNYINNSQRLNGIVEVSNKNLEILSCSFENNSGGALFAATSAQIYIYHCSIDKYSESIFSGVIDTYDMTTDPFHNGLKFYELGQCEGELTINHNKQTPKRKLSDILPYIFILVRKGR